MKHAFAWSTWLFVIVTGILLFSFQASQVPTQGSVSVIYSKGTLRTTIPYVVPRTGTGRLTLEVLDPENHTVGRTERLLPISRGKGTWQEDLKLTTVLPADDLVWHRLRYQFVYSDENQPAIEGTDSISQILRTPVVHIRGQQAYLTGGEAAVRVIVTDSTNEVIAGASSVRIELLPPDDKPRVLFTGPLNHHGTADAQFRFPAGVAGRHSLRYVVDTPIGSSEITQPIRLDNTASILLTTEKPIYQPGQTIHMRALALDRSTHEATAGRKLVFEVEDSRGNKVFKHSTQTSKFGIALGSIWPQVQLPRAAKRAAYWTALYGTYVNWLFTTLAAVFGTAALSPITAAGHTGKPWQESLVTAGFLSVGLAITACSLLLLWGLRAKASQ